MDQSILEHFVDGNQNLLFLDSDVILYPLLPSDSSKHRTRDGILLSLPLLIPSSLSRMHFA